MSMMMNIVSALWISSKVQIKQCVQKSSAFKPWQSSDRPSAAIVASFSVFLEDMDDICWNHFFPDCQIILLKLMTSIATF